QARDSVGLWLDLFFFSSRRRHTRFDCDWSSDVCSSDLDAKSMRIVRAAVTQRWSTPWDLTDSLEGAGDTALFASAEKQQKLDQRSEERRVGKECRSRWSAYH